MEYNLHLVTRPLLEFAIHSEDCAPERSNFLSVDKVPQIDYPLDSSMKETKMRILGITKASRLLEIALFVAVMILVACYSGPPQISIDGAKATLSPAIVGEAVVSMTIRNQGGADVLTGVKTDIPGVTVMLHVMQGERMAMVEAVEVRAKNNLEFKMGGSHIMIADMPKTMRAGSRFNMTLVFRKSGEKQVPLTLEGAMVMPMGHDHMHM